MDIHQISPIGPRYRLSVYQRAGSPGTRLYIIFNDIIVIVMPYIIGFTPNAYIALSDIRLPPVHSRVFVLSN